MRKQCGTSAEAVRKSDDPGECVASASGWTGKDACALQAALRLSNEAFAERLGIGVRTVAGWHQKPTLRPQSAMQQILDTALEQATVAEQSRFTQLTATGEPATDDPAATRRLESDPDIAGALHWLDQHAGWTPGTARREVTSRLSRLDVRQLQARGTRRGGVDQRVIADVLGTYYRDRIDGHGRYSAAGATTSVITRADWLDLACPLMPPADQFTVTNTAAGLNIGFDDEVANRAAQRIAETLALNVRLTDGRFFRLVDVEPANGSITGSMEIIRSVSFVLTVDMLEGELVDAIADGAPVSPGTLALRDRYLPDLASVVDLPSRLCAGGTLALCAIARPADPFRGPADYVLLVQERSGHVVNAARRLAVIPKGFHEPMNDYRADAHLGATLRREMEEELFGRDDVDSTNGDQRSADPMHPSRLSEPMRWLTAEPDRMRVECTGFGLNLMSGNFEFPALIVIDDEEFWTRFGGQIEANWEATSLRQYSSRDSAMLRELINDRAWSNEGLFALLQGLRRLSQLGGDRVDLPSIEWEIRQ
jgi:DNA-binding transcriptional regulator YiaG